MEKIKSFHEYMFEEVEDDSGEDTEQSIEQLIQNLIQLSLQNISQFNIYHWLTNNKAQHLALGEFYTGLQTQLDKFVEQAFIKFKVNEFGDFKNPTVLEFSHDIDIINEKLATYTDAVVSVINELETDNENQNLIDILSGVLELIKTLQYKLGLE